MFSVISDCIPPTRSEKSDWAPCAARTTSGFKIVDIIAGLALVIVGILAVYHAIHMPMEAAWSIVGAGGMNILIAVTVRCVDCVKTRRARHEIENEGFKQSYSKWTIG